jgi:outer membrane protein OmpA-like peptidoglycan-associated protein
MSRPGWAAATVAALTAVACAQVPDRVVLLPEAAGQAGALRVQTQRGMIDLTAPYATAEIRDGVPVAGTTTADEVDQRYGSLLARKPRAPVSWTVYFVSGRNSLTPESAAVLERVRAAADGSPSSEVMVIGHTDRVGSVEANDQLSLSRAVAVRKILISAGFAESVITVVGRGEREPLVPTADEVPEARNRRVEIRVR